MIYELEKGKVMGLNNLKTEEIIEVIKQKNAHYSKGAYLFFDNEKLSPSKIFEKFEQI